MRCSAALVLLLAFLPVAEAQTSQTAELLQKIAATYNNIHSYVIAVQRDRRGGNSPIPSDHIADMQHGLFLPREPALLNSAILLASSGKNFRYQIEATGTKNPMVWLTNGKTTWHYWPNVNKYTQTSAEPWPSQAGPGRGLPGIEWKYFAKFRAIAGMGNRAKLAKIDIPPDDTCPATSAILELQLRTGADAATEELHVMTRSGLVCESVVRSRLPFGGHMEYFTDTTSWTYRQTNGKIDPTLFLFTPPKHAKRVLHSTP